jgi:membrane-associated protease RseP (regulator of RpoE activity)
MRRYSNYAAAALVAGILVSHAAVGKEPALLSLGAEHFTQTASITEEAHATKITTEPGYVERRGLMGEVWRDEYLTALIDHDSGRVTYGLNVLLTYRGAARSYKTAEYRGLDQLETVPVTVLKREAINCPTGECTYTEYLAIPIDEVVLRHIAQGYVAGSPALWRFRVVAKGGAEYQGSLSNAEVAGLLAKVDAYVQNPTARQAPPLPPPPPPARLDFGISGLSVSPSAEAPNRAGVLVVGVSPGSIAQKAGIITGDIIYEFDGRSIRSPGDLQGAVAASAAHSSAHIGLYRGSEVATLEAHF